MLTLFNKERSDSKRDASKFDEIRLLYSSRAERLKILQKISVAQIKKSKKKIEKKRKIRKILIQLPKFETDYSKANLNEDLLKKSPNSRNSQRPKRIIFKSDLEKTYKNRPYLSTPHAKFSIALF